MYPIVSLQITEVFESDISILGHAVHAAKYSLSKATCFTMLAHRVQ